LHDMSASLSKSQLPSQISEIQISILTNAQLRASVERGIQFLMYTTYT